MKNLLMTLALLAALQINASETIEVKVKGMVCSFCTTGVEKTFSKREEVKKISVNMDEKVVSIILNESAKMKDELITELITDSGFNVAKISRTKVKSGDSDK